MDMQLTVKIVHMISVTLLIGVVIARAFTLFVGVQGNQPNPVARKLFVALQHLSMTLIVLTGLTSLVIKNFEVQSWFYAKVVLFLVLFSSLIKAYKKDDHILLLQRRAGLAIAVVALIAIIGLVMLKPNFG
ncbi:MULTISPECIES: SirB2 family protein [unclassified Acinetobacter]|uniref:SirB2 family protein n=1 Tax=unclassified Acinetobacter TaxID=196816 RepID=UPI000A35394B|nr:MULTISPECIES: SirB2 family protein [unclassified Acinetobacter]OTG97605.1 invasion protein expression up-regulator SirB [Acinetobacter sp. ANC 4654]OTH00123.1 invasion protein expression up-regulator SirB [Acinetobacter sp. ANC 4973]